MYADLMVKNGKIIDGTGAPPYPADLAVRSGRILGTGRLGDLDAKK